MVNNLEIKLDSVSAWYAIAIHFPRCMAAEILIEGGTNCNLLLCTASSATNLSSAEEGYHWSHATEDEYINKSINSCTENLWL